MDGVTPPVCQIRLASFVPRLDALFTYFGRPKRDKLSQVAHKSREVSLPQQVWLPYRPLLRSQRISASMKSSISPSITAAVLPVS
jgi:hypothetical protein